MRFSNIKQAGISLLEVNLALAVLATSLSVIINAYQQTGTSATLLNQRQQAYLLMAQMVAVLPSYEPTHLSYIASINSSAIPALDCFSGTICSQQDGLVSWYHTWTHRAQQKLPSGSVAINCVQQCQRGTQVEVVIRWLSIYKPKSVTVVNATDTNCDKTACMQLSWLL